MPIVAIGRALGTPPGRTWVRLRTLDASCYAENEASVPAPGLPVSRYFTSIPSCCIASFTDGRASMRAL